MVSNSSEFFSSLALEVRRELICHTSCWPAIPTDGFGYLPDAYDVERKTYAAYQSPKYCNQFPFTEESGEVMVTAMSDLLNSL